MPLYAALSAAAVAADACGLHCSWNERLCAAVAWPAQGRQTPPAAGSTKCVFAWTQFHELLQFVPLLHVLAAAGSAVLRPVSCNAFLRAPSWLLFFKRPSVTAAALRGLAVFFVSGRCCAVLVTFLLYICSAKCLRAISRHASRTVGPALCVAVLLLMLASFTNNAQCV